MQRIVQHVWNHEEGHLGLVRGSSSSASLVYTSITRVITWIFHIIVNSHILFLYFHRKEKWNVIFNPRNGLRLWYVSLCVFSQMKRYQKPSVKVIFTSHNFSLCAFSLMIRYHGLSSSPVPTKGTWPAVYQPIFHQGMIYILSHNQSFFGSS